jgi:hypothetical protein
MPTHLFNPESFCIWNFFNLCLTGFIVILQKAVVEVLNHYDVSPPCESPIHKTKPRRTAPSADQLMQRCRVVLRTLAEADNLATFSVLIGGPEGHGSKRLRGMVARPLDFRTIDARLAAGSYGGSVDAFAEDVRQVCLLISSRNF